MVVVKVEVDVVELVEELVDVEVLVEGLVDVMVEVLVEVMVDEMVVPKVVWLRLDAANSLAASRVRPLLLSRSSELLVGGGAETAKLWPDRRMFFFGSA